MKTDIMQLHMTKYMMAKSHCSFIAAALSMVAAVGINIFAYEWLQIKCAQNHAKQEGQFKT